MNRNVKFYIFAIFALIATSVFVYGNIKSSRLKTDSVYHVIINETDLWIDGDYFDSVVPSSIKSKDVLLRVTYPQFDPVGSASPSIMGVHPYYIRWLIQDASVMKSLSEAYASQKRSLQADDFIGIQYELARFSQPNNKKNDGGDLWVEGSKDMPDSFIRCSKKHSEITKPQCSHYVWADGFLYDIGYDKNLLPYWKEIKENIFSLTQNFKNKPE
jgi:hypothetical protein